MNQIMNQKPIKLISYAKASADNIVILTYCCTFRGITPLRGVLSLLAGQTHYGTTG